MAMSVIHSIRGYTYHADLYCHYCGHDLPAVDLEGNDKHTLFSWDLGQFTYEQDGQEVFMGCAKCGSLANEW